MQITKVGVTFEWNETRKDNAGNYRKGVGSYTVEASVEEADDLNRVNHVLWNVAMENVKASVAPFIADDYLRITEVWLGLPDEELLRMGFSAEQIAEMRQGYAKFGKDPKKLAEKEAAKKPAPVAEETDEPEVDFEAPGKKPATKKA